MFGMKSIREIIANVASAVDTCISNNITLAARIAEQQREINQQTENIAFYSQAIVDLQTQLRHQNERADIARNERFALEHVIKRAAYEFQTAHKATLARLEHHDSLIKAQDEAIASLDAVDSEQGKLIRANANAERFADLSGGLNRVDCKIDELETAFKKNLEWWNKLGATVHKLQTEDNAAMIEARDEAAKAGNLAWQIHAKQGAHGLDIKANAENIERLTKRLDDIHRVLNITIKEDNERDAQLRTQSKCQEINAESLAKLDQRVSDVIASLQYTGAPAEFVRYTHAADLAEVVRKLIHVELNSFDFSPRIDIAVRDAAIRTLTNMTNDRRQFGSFAMWGGAMGHAAGGGSGESIHHIAVPKQSTVHVQQDADGKPVNFTADGKGKKPD